MWFGATNDAISGAKQRLIAFVFSYRGFYLIAATFLCIWLVAAVIFPWAQQGTWLGVQAVWDRWQAWNVGVIAFMASVVALLAAQYRFTQERRRNFVAARSFLSEQLSALTEYNKLCFAFLKEAHSKAVARDQETPLALPVPDLPEGYRTVFSECIRHGRPEVSQFLAGVLTDLQVQNSRLRLFFSNFHPNYTTIVLHASFVNYMKYCAIVQAKVNMLLPFARAKEPFRNIMKLEDAYNALNYNDISPNQYTDLEETIKLLVDRENVRARTPDPEFQRLAE